MYIDSIILENVRTFGLKTQLKFLYPTQDLRRVGTVNQTTPNKPKLPNVNLVFGDNASGKTTVLESIALSVLGPTASDAKINPRPLIRFDATGKKSKDQGRFWDASIRSTFVLHGGEAKQDAMVDGRTFGSSDFLIKKRGELESFYESSERPSELFQRDHVDGEINWRYAYESDNPWFFIVAYGASRRTEQKTDFAISHSKRSRFTRATRVESVMIEGYPLVPLDSWFPEKPSKRREECIEIINKLLGRGHLSFLGKQKSGDFVFRKGRIEVPFRSLSDGYRAYIGWISDLLYHMNIATQSMSMRMVDLKGIVLVDEIDLHLHPKWQMTVIPTISKALPNVQFIFTSHSPLVAGSLESLNITQLNLGTNQQTRARQFKESVHGLDADQILVSDLFGLESTRAPEMQNRLYKLRIAARRGDDDAAKKLIAALAKGLEASE